MKIALSLPPPMKKPRLIILDRDGVINEDSPHFIKSPAEFVPIPGSFDAIAQLKAQGLLVAVATNQSGLARGLFTKATLQAIHHKLPPLDYLAYCPHGPEDHCDCRKPKPGLLLTICQALKIDIADALFVGDSFRDYEAAHAINMRFALVLTGKGNETLQTHPEIFNKTNAYKDLNDLTQHLSA